MSEAVDPRLQALSVLLQVEREARRAESQANLAYVFVNDTRNVLPARQAVFWALSELGNPRVQRASHVSEVDHNAPMVHWLDQLAGWVAAQEWRNEVHVFTRADVPVELAAGWGETVAAYVLHLPLSGSRSGGFGGLLLMAEAPWLEGHLALAGLLGDCYGHAWEALAEPERQRQVIAHLKRFKWRYAAGVVLLFLLPIRQYVLAPAEVVPDGPVIVAAPLAGMIGRIEVKPNQVVKAGDVLLRFEDTELSNRLAVAERQLGVAQAEFLRNAQQAFDCTDANCSGSVVQSRAAMEREQAQAEWAAAQKEQGVVRAPKDGVVIFGDATDLEGRPVRAGERIMMIADPARVRLRVTVPIADAIATEAGTHVVFYPNVSPLTSINGTVVSSSYEPVDQPDHTLAYELRARVNERGAKLGWRGTAKIYGGRAPLAYQMFRKPLARLRQIVGL